MSETTPITRLSSSLRMRSAEESLALVVPFARSRGVVRVVDTTWLDNVGLPVYASIRPDGMDGNIWVHAGKGFTHAEAKIGAYMEAIEFSYVEPGRNELEWFMSTPRQIIESFQSHLSFADFCAFIEKRAVLDDPIAVVRGQEIAAGLGDVQVPAELVFLPFNPPGQSLYGNHTNGLASGNTVLEATVHAVTEVLERHVHSFEQLDNQSVFINLEQTTPKLEAMTAKLKAAGLETTLRYSENEFGMAYFTAYVLEPDATSATTLASGHGFHPVKEIAAIRALAEAVQSRLTFIHGGREDIIDQYIMFDAMRPSVQKQAIARLKAGALSSTRSMPWADVPDYEGSLNSLDEVWQLLLQTLSRGGMHHVVQLVLTKPTDPFQVVKAIVPGAEVYSHDCPRVGPRLLAHFSQ